MNTGERDGEPGAASSLTPSPNHDGVAAHRPATVRLVDEGQAFHSALLRSGGRAWLTPALVAVNLAIFVIMVASGVPALSPGATDVLPWGANYGPYVLTGQPWRLLTSAFLHFGLLHVALNMFALWQVGRLVERLFRTSGFAVLYLVSALGGSVASSLVHPLTVSAGASGAVFGVYGAFLAYLLRRRGAIPASVLNPLRGSALVFVGYNLVIGMSVEQIDNSAHVGGLVSGFLCGLVLATPLGQPLHRRRAALALLVAIVGAMAMVVLRPSVPDFVGELNAFGKDEARVVKRYNEIVDQAKGESISDATFATMLEREIVQPWNAVQARLQRLDGRLPAREQKIVMLLLQYVDQRALGWSQLAAAARVGDSAAVTDATASLRRADQLLEQLNKQVE
jgi:rhomboid protease GluP